MTVKLTWEISPNGSSYLEPIFPENDIILNQLYIYIYIYILLKRGKTISEKL